MSASQTMGTLFFPHSVLIIGSLSLIFYHILDTASSVYQLYIAKRPHRRSTSQGLEVTALDWMMRTSYWTCLIFTIHACRKLRSNSSLRYKRLPTENVCRHGKRNSVCVSCFPIHDPCKWKPRVIAHAGDITWQVEGPGGNRATGPCSLPGVFASQTYWWPPYCMVPLIL